MCVVIHIRHLYNCPVGNENGKVCSTLVLWVRIGIAILLTERHSVEVEHMHLYHLKSCGGC